MDPAGSASVQTARAEPEAERLQSVKRALAVLELLAARPEGITPKELGQKLDLHLSTIYRLLNTLAAAGYAVPDSGLFRLGPRIAFLHHGYLAAVTPSPEALAFVHALQQRTGETAMLNRLDGADIVSVAAVPGNLPGSHPPGYIGMAGPAHAVATGKVLLAWLPPALLTGYLDRLSREMAPRFPLANPDAFGAELARIRDAGYAVDRGGTDQRACCVAAPIFGQAGEVSMAIAVVGPCARIKRQESTLVSIVRAVAIALGAMQTIIPSPASAESSAASSAAAAVESAIAVLTQAMSRVR